MLQHTFLLLFSCFLLTNSVFAGGEWYCGSSTFTGSTQIAYGLSLFCNPTLREKMNSACKIHDECYIDLLGQKSCDKQFCEQLMTATAEEDSCCIASHLFCVGVEIGGEVAYGEGKSKGFYEEFEGQMDEGAALDKKTLRSGVLNSDPQITLLDFEGFKMY